MNSDQLYKFSVVAEYESMTKAAESMFITQSALSHAISSLEKDLNTTLFIRDRKKLILTHSGEKLLEYAKSIFQIMGQAEASIKDESTINITSGFPASAVILANYPNNLLQNICFNEIKSIDMPKMLLNGSLDIAICDDIYMRAIAFDKKKETPIGIMPLCREKLGLYVQEGHPLFNRSVISYNDFKDIPISTRLNGVMFHEWLENIQNAIGYKFNIDFKFDNSSYSIIRNKITYPELSSVNSIFNPELRYYKEQGNFKFIPIKDFYSTRAIFLWYRANNQEKIQGLLDSYKQFFKNYMTQKNHANEEIYNQNIRIVNGELIEKKTFY